jgi:branched-chain amino acid transport system ATP-binding protein
MLVVADLHASYGGIKALRGVSLKVEEGEIVAVLGANGAGKSTLLKVLSAQHRPDSGAVTFLGRPRPAAAHKVVEAGMVQVPEGRQIFSDLTVHQNLMAGAFLRKDKDGVKRDLDVVFDYFPRLRERIGQYGGLLSGGEQQMLAISRGLMARPRILMLDEPSLGLGPIIVNQIFRILAEINRHGTAILLVEQNAYKALAIANRGYLMTTGEIEREGTREELGRAENLYRIYLGKASAEQEGP